MNVLEAIANRRSVREYSSKPIPSEVMGRMREALRCAPSACNIQPWHFILVENQGLRREVAAAANGQHWIAQAPVIVVACGDTEAAYKRMGGHGSSVDVDVAIAIDHLTLAAVDEGMGTCWIGAFAEEKVKGLLDVPANIRVVAMTPLGYPASPDLIRRIDEGRRKPDSEIFSTDRFKLGR